MNSLHIKWLIYDFAQRLTPSLGASLLHWCALLLYFFNFKSTALKIALQGHRLGNKPQTLWLIDRIIKRGGSDTLKSLLSPPANCLQVAKRTLILTWPIMEDGTVKRRGVLLIKFTTNFSYFLHKVDIKQLERFFHVVLEPSWAGYADADILAWEQAVESPIYIQAAEYKDRATISSLCRNIIPLSIGSGSWVDYRKFVPGKGERQFDSIYVANGSPIKRVHVYLRAIQAIKKAGHVDYRGALVCAAWGGVSRAKLQDLIDYFEVSEQCKLFFAIPQTQVANLVAMSKSCILLSLKEGSNRSLYEAMFCDTPVILLAENIGVDKGNINEFTGVVTYEFALPHVLLEMRARSRAFTPRAWAIKHISPDQTIEDLARAITAVSSDPLAASDLYIKVNSPEAKYRDALGVSNYEFTTPLLQLFSKPTSLERISAELQALEREFQNALLSIPDCSISEK